MTKEQQQAIEAAREVGAGFAGPHPHMAGQYKAAAEAGARAYAKAIGHPVEEVDLPEGWSVGWDDGVFLEMPHEDGPARFHLDDEIHESTGEVLPLFAAALRQLRGLTVEDVMEAARAATDVSFNGCDHEGRAYSAVRLDDLKAALKERASG